MDLSVPADLSDLKTQLDSWRGSHRQRARIPDHFYTAAVSLLDRYSVSTICRETRLRPASLRKRLAPIRATTPAPLAPPTPFLQLTAADLAPRPADAADRHARLLFERADGSRLTIHVPSADRAHLESLCSSLLRS